MINHAEKHGGSTIVKVTFFILQEMQKRFPDTDLTTELVHDVAWNDIANKIGFMHGKYLHQFWECNIKYRDEEGKLRFKKPGKLPVKVGVFFI